MSYRSLALACLLACAHGKSVNVTRQGALDVAHFWARVHPDLILPQASEECLWTADMVDDGHWLVSIKRKTEAGGVAYPGCLCDYALIIDAESAAPTRYRCGKGIDKDLTIPADPKG